MAFPLAPAPPNETQPPVEPQVQPEEESTTQDEEALIPEEVELALKTILSNVEHEDEEIRITQLKIWRQLQQYGKGIQDLYWDEVATDWRSFNVDDDIDVGPNRNINIFRAHMESVIAALSVKIPGTVFFPDDADSPLDCETAEGFSAVAELIQKHNKSALAIVKCLYIMWTQGTVFAYNYYKVDPKFGTISIPKKEQKEITSFDIWCSYCGNHLGNVKETPPSAALHCTECGQTEIPENLSYVETVETIVGYNDSPKGREAFDFFGPINVKVPFYARKQEDCGYLLLKLDPHFAMLKSIFKEDEVGEGNPGEDTYERWMRLSSEYQGNIPANLNTLKSLWLRPWMYYSIVNDEETRDYLLKTYAEGCYINFVDDKIVSIVSENLDDHWTISVDPLSDFIHNEPLGKPLQPIQEMRNDLVDLSFKSIEYGIPENFADPKVLDFQKYKDQPASPGMFTPAMPKAGQSIGDSFFQTSPSHLTAEVQEFGQQLDTDGQFVVGDFPSVYGGPSEGSKTAFEYDKSNSQALQRLSLTWKRLVDLWTDLMGKCVVEFVENMKEDEKNVKKENGRFINVWIRKQNLSGKIGNVEPETSEQLPQSWEQKWHLITNLLEMKDPAINSVLTAPENSHLMKQAVSLPQFYIPGDNDRTKQFNEIYDFIAGDPNVHVDVDIDDHAVHMRVIKHYLTSSQGINLYKTNPQAYQAIIQHYKEHQQAQQQMQMQMQSDQQNAPVQQ